MVKKTETVTITKWQISQLEYNCIIFQEFSTALKTESQNKGQFSLRTLL